MNSRERVMQSLNHVQPDRVPVDFGGHRSSGIMAIAYVRLRDYLGLPRRLPRVYDIPQQLAVLDDDVLERFHVDAIEMGRGFARDESDWHSWTLSNGAECLIPKWVNPVRQDANWIIHGDDGTPIAIQKKGVLYFEQINWPFAKEPERALTELDIQMGNSMWTSGKMASPPGPVPGTPEGARYLADGARKLREGTSRAVIGLFGGNLFELGQFMFGMENFYVLMGGNPELTDRLLDAMVESHLKRLESWLAAVGPYIDIVLFGDDLGMQTGPQISPRMYRRYLKPRHQRLWGRAKELHPHLKVMLHSCGGIFELMDDFVDAGLDTTNPVQITCAGMEPERLKKHFAGRLALWGGGCDTRQVLPSATPAQVREHVLRMLDIMAPGGDFVFQQVHNIMADVPPENIVAMFDAVAEYNGVK